MEHDTKKINFLGENIQTLSLIHISVGDVVEVTVLSVDEGKKRISLTMREEGSPQQG